MRDVPTINPPDHVQVKLTIVEADIDIGIIPLVKWLNSFYGIMTRASCEGTLKEQIVEGQISVTGSFPYIVIWVSGGCDTAGSDLKEVRSKLEYPSVAINRLSQGDVSIYHIMFGSKEEMKRIQKKITGQ